MKVYKAIPKEAWEVRETWGGRWDFGGSLAGRRKPFHTLSSKRRRVNIQDGTSWALSLDNEALQRVSRRVLIAYEVDEREDEYVVATGYSTSPTTYYYNTLGAVEKCQAKTGEVLIYGGVESERVELLEWPKLKKYPGPYEIRRPGRTALWFQILGFFGGEMEIGLMGKGVSCYRITEENMEATLRFARARNAHGWHVFMRPIEDYEPYYTLLDDLPRPLKLKDTYISLQTSWESYQTWVQTDNSLTIRSKLNLIRKFGADLKAHPNRRWGRLPGFTNRKKKHQREGQFPWVKLLAINGIAV